MMGINKYVYIVFITIISLQGLYVFKLSKDVKSLNEELVVSEMVGSLLREEGEELRREVENSLIVNKELQKINIEYKEKIKVFREHDFEKLSNAKPKLMEKRVNDATEKIFKSIACHSGDSRMCE